MKKPTVPTSRGLAAFVQQHAAEVTGVVRGFDRLRLQGSLPSLYCGDVMAMYLDRARVRLREFKTHVRAVTARIKTATQSLVQAAGRPLHYLPSAAIRKDALAEEIRQRDGIDAGLIAVFSTVELCRTWTVRPDRARQALDLQLRPGKCTHLYFYCVHPQFGRMHLRLQTWFPFLLHVCLNGREWLARQLTAEGIGFTRADNCLPRIDDVARAQALLDQQTRTRFAPPLDALVRQFHPVHRELRAVLPLDYYWTVAECEYATDVMFRDRAALQRIYPALVQHSLMSFGAEQVLRFFGRKQIGAQTQLTTDRRRGDDGVRVKHWLNGNSLKFYDKGSVLRDELTINDAGDFRVWRKTGGHPERPKSWQPLRRSVADLPRRAELGRAATDRHLEALAATHHGEPLGRELAQLCRPVTRDGRRHRALNPFAPEDHALLAAVNRGEFIIRGLRNAELRKLLYPRRPAHKTDAQLSARVSRQLARLRAHGLIKRVPRTHRYLVTTSGRRLITAILAGAQADTDCLTLLAA